MIAFGVIGLGTLVGPLDSAVNVSFPSITAHFNQPDTAIQWVIVSYVITYATLLLIFGRLGDLFGHLGVFRAGLAISAVSFVASSLAHTFELLLVGRALQGLGTAMVLSCGPALAASVFSETQRARAVGSYTAVLGVGMTIGPSLGGLLVAFWGWPAVFFFRIPIALIALALTFIIRLPEQPRAHGHFNPARALALAGLLCVTLVAISRLRNGLMPLAEGIAYIAIAGTALAVLATIGRAKDHLTTSAAQFRNPDLILVTLTAIAVNLVGFAVMLFVPYFLTRIAELPVSLAGLLLAASPLGIVAGGSISPKMAARIGAKPVALAGAILVTASTAWIGLWQPDMALGLMAVAAFVHGAGLGIYQAAQLDISTRVLSRENRGVAGALVMLTRTLGVVLAASTLTAVFISIQSATAASGSETAYLAAFQTTFLVAAGGLATLLGLSLLRPGTWFRHSPT